MYEEQFDNDHDGMYQLFCLFRDLLLSNELCFCCTYLALIKTICHIYTN